MSGEEDRRVDSPDPRSREALVARMNGKPVGALLSLSADGPILLERDETAVYSYLNDECLHRLEEAER